MAAHSLVVMMRLVIAKYSIEMEGSLGAMIRIPANRADLLGAIMLDKAAIL